MKGFPDLPPIWWAGSIAVIYLAKWIAPGLHMAAPVLTLVSWVLFGLALILIGWAALQFFRKKTPIEPHHKPKALIIEGPYRLSRNPIYLSLVMLTLASALGHGSLIGLLVAFGLWWVLDRRFAAPEEAMLRKAFDAAAEEYIRRTRRWL